MKAVTNLWAYLRCDVVDALVVALMIVVVDEGLDLGLKIPRQEVVSLYSDCHDGLDRCVHGRCGRQRRHQLDHAVPYTDRGAQLARSVQYRLHLLPGLVRPMDGMAWWVYQRQHRAWDNRTTARYLVLRALSSLFGRRVKRRSTQVFIGRTRLKGWQGGFAATLPLTSSRRMLSGCLLN